MSDALVRTVWVIMISVKAIEENGEHGAVTEFELPCFSKRISKMETMIYKSELLRLKLGSKWPVTGRHWR